MKRLGIPDRYMWLNIAVCSFNKGFVTIYSNIILMLADDMACNPRNPRPGMLHSIYIVCIHMYL